MGLGRLRQVVDRLIQDTHCHLDFPAYDADRDQVVARARAAGVERILIPGTSPDTWARTRACAAQYGLEFALGVHPWFLGEPTGLADQLDGAWGIGECGLDRKGDLDQQLAVLRPQLELASDLQLPVILHCVGRHRELLAELERFPSMPGVLHSYSGPVDLVPRFLGLGLDFSFGGAVTWPEARKVHARVRAVPRDRLRVESDGPDQALQARRGGRSEPADVVAIRDALDRLRAE